MLFTQNYLNLITKGKYQREFNKSKIFEPKTQEENYAVEQKPYVSSWLAKINRIFSSSIIYKKEEHERIRIKICRDAEIENIYSLENSTFFANANESLRSGPGKRLRQRSSCRHEISN
uniref:Uncharacterized protein n=1 Tax=Strongyloides papillosus TaxID=174720 RepID=A0A0N5BHK1_STREA